MWLHPNSAKHCIDVYPKQEEREKELCMDAGGAHTCHSSLIQQVGYHLRDHIVPAWQLLVPPQAAQPHDRLLQVCCSICHLYTHNTQFTLPSAFTHPALSAICIPGELPSTFISAIACVTVSTLAVIATVLAAQVASQSPASLLLRLPPVYPQHLINTLISMHYCPRSHICCSACHLYTRNIALDNCLSNYLYHSFHTGGTSNSAWCTVAS